MPVWTFGNFPVMDKWQASQNLLELGLRTPKEFRWTNTVMMPVGPQHGRGWLLMLRSDLARQSNFFETLHTVQIDNVPLGGWLPLKARKLMGGNKDPNALFLVEIVDGRYRCDNEHYAAAGTKQFNIRAPDTGGKVYIDPTDGDVTWTWSSMLSTIWGTMSSQLGGYPGLGFSPDGVPEGWGLIGVSAYAAMNEVLDKLDCAIAPNLDGSFRIVQLGKTDTNEVKNLNKQLERYQNQNLLIGDENPKFGTFGHMPGNVRVLHHVSYANYGEENLTARQTVTAPGGAWQMAPSYGLIFANPYGGDPAITHALWDDLPAVWSSTANAAINSTALNTRGTERANRFFQSLHGCPRLHETYSGALPIVPGATLKGVAWRQDAQGGTITEIFGHPNRRVSIANDARWKTLRNDESNTSIRPADFRPMKPLFPPLLQVVYVNKLKPSDMKAEALHSAGVDPTGNGVYNGRMAQFDSAALGWSPREPCWVIASDDNLVIEGIFGGFSAAALASDVPFADPIYGIDGHSQGSVIKTDDSHRRMAVLVGFLCPHDDFGVPLPGYEGDCRPLYQTQWCEFDERDDV